MEFEEQNKGQIIRILFRLLAIYELEYTVPI